MSERFQFAIKKISFFAVILSVSVLMTGLLFKIGVTRYWDTLFYDFCVKTRISSASHTKNPLIATIDLNDASLEALGEQIDTRKAFADITEVLNDVNASVIFDFIFRHEKTRDDAFAKAIALNGKAVTGVLAIDKETSRSRNTPYQELTSKERDLLKRHVWRINVINSGKIPEAETFRMPSPSLTEAAAQLGLINADPDHDGIYRHIQLLYKWEDGFLPSLSLAAGVLYWGIPVETITLKAGEYLALPLSDEEIIRVPIDEYGRVLVPFTETWVDQSARIPFHKIASARDNGSIFDEVFSDLNGRIALLAEISTSQNDYGPTSFERLYPLSGLHAEVLGGILDFYTEKSFIRHNSPVFKAVIAIILLCVSFLFVNFKKEITFHLGFLFTILVFAFFTIFRWQNNAISPWVSFPASLFLFMWIGAFLNRLFVRYRRQLLLHNALSRYFPRALARRIISEKKTDLKPVYRELTILFSDICSFTKWSSEKSPEDVHNFLNDYMESMAEILYKYGGTVDKFMGDGIIAFFGDLLEMPNHTEQCVRAAIEMQKKVKILAEKWKPLAGIDLNVRIGINTGKVIAGNLGSKTRVEYTVVGAAVNLAQRMESSAPAGGILVTADVKEKVNGIFNFTDKRKITAKGYSKAIDAYMVERRVEKRSF